MFELPVLERPFNKRLGRKKLAEKGRRKDTDQNWAGKRKVVKFCEVNNLRG
jgi:hypothetical protein